MDKKDLEGIRADLAMARHFANSDIAVHAVERVEAALAVEEATLRECDVGTVNEQAGRYRRFCRAFTRCRDCPFGGDANVPCVLAWAHRLHTPGSQEPANPAAGTPREPHVGQGNAAVGIRGSMDTPRIEDLVTTVLGTDWGRPTDAGCNVTASAAPTVVDRFELPF